MSKDNKQIKKHWWNCWLFHSWGSWGEPFCTGIHKYQNKKCRICGMIEQRKIGYLKNGER